MLETLVLTETGQGIAEQEAVHEMWMNYVGLLRTEDKGRLRMIKELWPEAELWAWHSSSLKWGMRTRGIHRQRCVVSLPVDYFLAGVGTSHPQFGRVHPSKRYMLQNIHDSTQRRSLTNLQRGAHVRVQNAQRSTRQENREMVPLVSEKLRHLLNGHY